MKRQFYTHANHRILNKTTKTKILNLKQWDHRNKYAGEEYFSAKWMSEDFRIGRPPTTHEKRTTNMFTNEERWITGANNRLAAGVITRCH